MESEIKDLLGHVLQRLDKLQQQQDIQQQRLSQLDHVIERFDTVQNVLETQNQKHQLMSEKLDQINLILKEQLRYAHSDILVGINVLQSKLCDAGVGSSLSQSAGKGQIPQLKDDMEPQFEETVEDFQNLKSFNIDDTMKDLETSLDCQVPVTSVFMNDDTKAEFNDFFEKIKEQVMGRIQLSEAQTERSLNQAVNELKQHLDTTNSQTKDVIQSSFQKQVEEPLSSTISQLKDQIERISSEVLQCSLQRSMAVSKEVTKVKKTYALDFHGKDFHQVTMANSICTGSWNISHLLTSVQGCYYFTKKKEMVVKFGFYPHSPLPESVDSVKVKVMIADDMNQNEVKRLFVMKKTMNVKQSCDEEEIGRVTCDDLMTTLHGNKYYDRNMGIILRFIITFCYSQ